MKLKFLLTSILLVAATLCFFNGEAQQKNENRRTEIRGSLNVTSDSRDGSGETLINYVEDGHRYKIRLKGSKIMEMYLDGNEVAGEDFGKYEPLVKRILVQIEKDREQAMKDRAQAERDREQAERDREQAERDRAQAEKDREQADRDREQADEDRKQAERDREQAERDREQAEKDREQAIRDREHAVIDRAQAEEDRKRFDAMIDELIKDKLLESRAALTSLELDDEGLFINRKEQAENIHSRYKQKYLKGKNSRIYYRNSGGSRNISID